VLPAEGPLIVGGDFNAWFGYRDAAFKEIARWSAPRRWTTGAQRSDRCVSITCWPVSRRAGGRPSRAPAAATDPITIRSSQCWMFAREVHMRLATIVGCIAAVSTALAGAPAAPPVTRCGIEMRNVALHVADGVVLEAARSTASSSVIRRSIRRSSTIRIPTR
jgi:hypothetical protein